jgi:hemerythrin
MFRSKKIEPTQNAHCLLKDVGVNDFNRQHLRLASYAVELNQLVEELASREVTSADWRRIDALFSRVTRFVEIHFSEEEALLLKHDYPEFPAHKRLHDRFVEELAGIQSKINNRNLSFKGKFGAMLWNWLYHHINEEDYKYREFLQQRLQS